MSSAINLRLECGIYTTLSLKEGADLVKVPVKCKGIL